MQYHLQNNIQKQKREDDNAIPQVALSAQNKNQTGRFFLEGSGLTNAVEIKNPSSWKGEVEESYTPPFKTTVIKFTQSGATINQEVLLNEIGIPENTIDAELDATGVIFLGLNFTVVNPVINYTSSTSAYSTFTYASGEMLLGSYTDIGFTTGSPSIEGILEIRSYN